MGRPYISVFQSVSSRSVAPLREIPANRPRWRDQVRISAVIAASVCACVSRPTGPAATEASPPRVNLVESSRFMPLLFITSMNTSVSAPPIWNPKLPPSTRTAAGADQPTPSLLRQETNPLPYLAPTMNAPFFNPGTITMHCALFSRSCGIDLSGVPITSLNARAAAWSRVAASLSAPINAKPVPSTARSFQFKVSFPQILMIHKVARDSC